MVKSDEASSPTETPTFSKTVHDPRSSPQRNIQSVSPDMSHVSVIVVGGVGENDSIHVIDSSLATTAQSQHDTPTIDQVVERSYSSASHSSNTSSIGTGLSISSSSNSAVLNTKHKYNTSREMNEQSVDKYLHSENNENIENRGPSQNSLRVEGTTIDETEEDMIEEPSSYNQYHPCISGQDQKLTKPIGEDSEEDSGMVDDGRSGNISDAAVATLPFDSPMKVESDVS